VFHQRLLADKNISGKERFAITFSNDASRAVPAMFVLQYFYENKFGTATILILE